MKFEWCIKIVAIFMVVTLFSVQDGAFAAGRRSNGNEPLARTLFYQGAFVDAEVEYENLLERNVDEKNFAKDMSVVLMEAMRYRDAVDVLLKYDVKGSWLGDNYLALGKFKSAVKAYQQECATPGDHTNEYILLGWVEALHGRHHNAINYYWQALQSTKRHGTARLLMARSFVGLAEKSVTEQSYFIGRAKEEYRQARKDDASLWTVFRDLALLAEKESKWKDAKYNWNRVKQVIGHSQEVLTAINRVQENILQLTATIVATPVPVIKAIESPVFRDIKIKPLGQKDDPLIRVGINRNSFSMAFGCMGSWRVLDSRGRQIWKGRAKRGYRIERHVDGKWYLKNWEGKLLKRIKRHLIIKPLNPAKPLVLFNHFHSDGYFWSGGQRGTRYYRGHFKVALKKKKLQLINILLLEDYLLSVVPGEMPALWPIESVKAQAVVARTDALLRRGTHRKQHYDVCTSAHCAVYQGIGVEHEQTHQAVAETQGEVLKKQNKLMPTFYSHACGGLTQSHREAWGKSALDYKHPGGILDQQGQTLTAFELPLAPHKFVEFLKTTPDVFCSDYNYSGRHSFRWMKIMMQEELTAILDRKYNIGEVESIRVKQRSSLGYVRRIDVTGKKGSKSIFRDYLRSSLGGLRSNLIHISPVAKPGKSDGTPIAWIIWGGGWGHGVGFCQAGVGAMGSKKFNYKEILKHYFPEGEILVWKK